MSCIVTLPQYQRCGFGRLLIDFSYLLSKHENIIGTPEKPLSDLGKLSYLSYWRDKIYRHLYDVIRSGSKELDLTIAGISKATALNTNDVASTLQWCKVIHKPDGSQNQDTKDDEYVFGWFCFCPHSLTGLIF